MKRKVLITGASSGFGEAMAHAFAAHGDDLILLARRADRLKKVAHDITCKHESIAVHMIAADVQHLTNTRDAIIQCLKQLGSIDILINNAGLALGVKPVHQAAFEDWQTMIQTNILGFSNVLHTVIPFMVAQNSGHIFNIGSTAGSWPYPGANVYGGTKAFVQNLSRNLRADLLGKHIKVTNIEPGMAKTEFSDVRLQDPVAAEAVYAGTQPLQAQDIADIVLWISNTPAHVNINAIEIMAISQAFAGLSVDRHMLDGVDTS